MIRAVADASFCGAWILQDETSERAEGLLLEVETGGVELVVPALWHYEMQNLLKMAHRRDRWDRIAVDAARAALANIPFKEVDVPDVEARAKLLEIAFEYDLTAYDAAYLELAKRLSAPLYSNDRALIRAAELLGVELPIQ